MENKKGLNFFFLFVAIILGAVLFKQFDFKTLKFEEPELAIIYMLVFATSIYFLIKDYKKKAEK